MNSFGYKTDQWSYLFLRENLSPLNSFKKEKIISLIKINYEQPQPLSQPFPFFLEEKFLVKILTRQ